MKITIEMNNSTYSILDMFERLLKSATYSFDGHIEIVEDEKCNLEK